MATAEELIIRVSADIEDLKRDMATVKSQVGDVGTETEKTESRTGKATKFIKSHWKAVAAGVAAVVGSFAAVGGKMISMAADADATGAKFNTIFSGMEVETQAWVDTFVESTGRHKYETMNMLSDIQAVTTAMGVEKEAGVDMAKSLLERSTDVAAFFNAQDADVLEAIKSGLTGEMEGMKKYGVILSEANVQKELANMLGAEGVKNATDAQKIQARTNIILQQTSAIQGQQASESLSYQEQLKKLSATLSVTFADAGKKAMESMTGLLIKINEILKGGGTAALSKIFEGLADILACVAEQVVDVAGAFLNWSKNGGFEAIKAFIQDGIVRMREALGPTLQAVKDFTGSGGLERLIEVAKIAWNSINDFNKLLQELGVYRAFGDILGLVVDSILNVIDSVATIIIWIDDMRNSFRNAYDDIDNGTSTFRETITNGWNAIRTAISNIVAGILQDIITTWNNIRTSIATAISNILIDVIEGWERVRAAVAGVVEKINNGISTGWKNAAEIVRTGVSGIVSAVESFGSDMYNAGAGIVQKAIEGIRSKIQELKNSIAEISNLSNSGSNVSTSSSSNARTGGSSSGGTGRAVIRTATTGDKITSAPAPKDKSWKFAEGGRVPSTGFHLLHEKEVVIPPKPNWNNLLVKPILNAFSQSGAAQSGGVSRMEITIHNYGDLRALEKTLLRSTQAGTRGNMRVI